MEKGFTTGSCAAAAAKAAAYMLLGGRLQERTDIITPSGERYSPKIEEARIANDHASCAVRKQSGDDPDITDGMLIYARVSYAGKDESSDGSVVISGGEGIGTVTRPGLDQPVGNAAINSVPRKMIKSEVEAAMDLFDHRTPLHVEIYAPEGKELAAKTFNPKLGIEGGISIIGTTGTVEPMSTRAILDTIMVQLRQQKAMGCTVAVVSPGNYGFDFMSREYGYDIERAVKCSNYIGETIDMTAEAGFKKMLLVGHAGKLVKVSGGIMNTHSKEADCRMELMAAAAIKSGADAKTASRILDCVSTEEAVDIYKEKDIDKQCFGYLMERIKYFLDKRSAGRIDIECIVYSEKHGLLGATEKAGKYMDEAKGIIR